MNAKQGAFVVGTAILFAILVGLAVDAFYTAPKYEKFCNNTFGPYGPAEKIPGYAVNCSVINSSEQNLANDCFNRRGSPKYKYDEVGCSIYESCDMCSKKFEDATNTYNRNAFYLIFITGIIAMIIGVFTTDIFGAGLMFGGILTSIYGAIRYFSELDKTARFLVVLVGFLIIVVVGRKKLSDIQQRNKPSSIKRKRR